MSASLSLVLAVMAFEVAGMLNVSDEARLYARESDDDSTATIDVENTPRLALTLVWPRTSVSLDYTPRFLWTEVNGPDPSPTLLLHDAGLFITWRDQRASLTLGQVVSIGDQSFARLRADRGGLSPDPDATLEPAPAGGATTTPDLDLLPRATVVRVLAIETSATFRYQWTGRLSTELRGSYGISGGADAEAQMSLIGLRTAAADLDIDYRITGRDTLGPLLSVEQISTSNDYDHWLGSMIVSWTRLFTPESGMELGAGAAVQETTDPLGARSSEIGPVVTASAWQSVRARPVVIALRSELGYRPHINVLTGLLQRRLFASAEASTVMGDTSVGVTLAGTQSFPSDAPDAARSISADLALEHALLQWLIAQLGGQISWQSFGGATEIASSRWMLYAGARAELPAARF